MVFSLLPVTLFSLQEDRMREVPFGMETRLQGVIVERAGTLFVVRDYLGGETRVSVDSTTSIKEKKKNPFRRATRYTSDQLLLGLRVELKGRGDRDGVLEAEEIRFTRDDLRVANTITSRVVPVEARLSETEMSLENTRMRLGDAERKLEQTTQEVAGQMEELDAAFHIARDEARGAQQTADDALAGVVAANERISSLDDYETAEALTILFPANSAKLPKEALPDLDQVVGEYQGQTGYLIEVKGFASADGDARQNHQLSQARADSVVRYLTETQDIPLRRIITPHGFGELKPVANNSTAKGRKMNRRVELRVLVNRSLSSLNQPDSGVTYSDMP
jgi:outer membrane protein OmpA-like peptidoglycan-associated protein